MVTSKVTVEPPAVGRIGILAGTGRLPALISDVLIANGQEPFIVNLAQDKPSWIANLDHAQISVARLSQLITTLRNAHVTAVTLAGGISARPGFVEFLSDWRMYGEFLRIFRALRRGDDGLLRVAVDFLERKGFKVVGVHQLAPALLAKEGTLTQIVPTVSDEATIKIGIDAAVELGRLDIGQAVVVQNRQVTAREDKHGTATMLARLGAGRSGQRSGVLVKWSKPNQELRVDLPSIGPDTVTQAAAAGLAGIVVEAGHSIILDKDEVIRLADTHGLFVDARGAQP